MLTDMERPTASPDSLERGSASLLPMPRNPLGNSTSHDPVSFGPGNYAVQMNRQENHDEVMVDTREVSSTQVYQDQRTVNLDQRSIHFQQHVHGPDPNMIGDLAASAATSGLRAEAASVVAGVQVEAAQAVAQARVDAESTRAEAMNEISRLRAQVEYMTRENQWVRGQLQASIAQSEHTERARETQTQNLLSLNGTEMQGIIQRLDGLELQLTRVESKLDTHQEYIQDLWTQQAPAPQVLQEGSTTPVVRLDNQDPATRMPIGFHMQPVGEEDDDQENPNLFGVGCPSSVGEPDDVERRALRTKDLHHLKLPTLPDSASQFRSWKNAVRTMLLSYDHSPEGLLNDWLNPAFQARGQQAELLRTSSGDFPRLDRVIASVLCKPEALKTSFGLKIQSYVELCESTSQQVRGRYIVNLVSREFDTSVAAGAITSSLELFQLPVPQDSAAALRHWRDRVVYILSQLPVGQRPNEELMSQWIFNTLKRHPLMRRVMDKYYDSSIGSPNRSFDALWEGVERALLEAQHDTNTQSLRDDLKRGPTHVKKTPAVTATKGKEKGSPKANPKQAASSSSSTQPNKGTGKSTGKGESKDKKDSGKEKPKGSGSTSSTGGKPTKPMTPADKSNYPCIYHAKGRCMRGDSCPYSHASTAQAAPKGTSNGPSGTAKVAAAVAILATSAVADSHSGFLEFVGDTGAGENLGSVEAFKRQGLNLPSDFVTTSSKPLNFLTGGATNPEVLQSAFGLVNLIDSIKPTYCPSVRWRCQLVSCVPPNPVGHLFGNPIHYLCWFHRPRIAPLTSKGRLWKQFVLITMFQFSGSPSNALMVYPPPMFLLGGVILWLILLCCIPTMRLALAERRKGSVVLIQKVGLRCPCPLTLRLARAEVTEVMRTTRKSVGTRVKKGLNGNKTNQGFIT